MVAGLARPRAGDVLADPLDRRGLAEAIEHHMGALGRQRAGDAEPDAAGRAGDDGRLVGKDHGFFTSWSGDR
jgi:hypothetical protein